MGQLRRENGNQGIAIDIGWVIRLRHAARQVVEEDADVVAAGLSVAA